MTHLTLSFLILIIIYLFAIMPKIVDKSYLTPFLGRHYAHRGLFGDKNVSPENSLLAFKLACDNDYGIELDVQLTKDKVPIVFHDYSLKRVSGIYKKISECNYDELKNIHLYNSDQKIPTLKEVLDLVDGRVPLIVELKGETSDISVCKFTTPLLDNYNGIYCVESFNPFIILWYKNNRPDIIRGQLATRMNKNGKSLQRKIQDFALENLLFNFLAKPHFIAFNHKERDMLSFNICKKIYSPLTFAYTIQSQEDLEKNRDKFDLFIFDSFIAEE